ncbi:hypothetical protein FRB90_002523, partial [Tulasnella sp. 427]
MDGRCYVYDDMEKGGSLQDSGTSSLCFTSSEGDGWESVSYFLARTSEQTFTTRTAAAIIEDFTQISQPLAKKSQVTIDLIRRVKSSEKIDKESSQPASRKEEDTFEEVKRQRASTAYIEAAKMIEDEAKSKEREDSQPQPSLSYSLGSILILPLNLDATARYGPARIVGYDEASPPIAQLEWMLEIKWSQGEKKKRPLGGATRWSLGFSLSLAELEQRKAGDSSIPHRRIALLSYPRWLSAQHSRISFEKSGHFATLESSFEVLRQELKSFSFSHSLAPSPSPSSSHPVIVYWKSHLRQSECLHQDNDCFKAYQALRQTLVFPQGIDDLIAHTADAFGSHLSTIAASTVSCWVKGLIPSFFLLALISNDLSEPVTSSLIQDILIGGVISFPHLSVQDAYSAIKRAVIADPDICDPADSLLIDDAKLQLQLTLPSTKPQIPQFLRLYTPQRPSSEQSPGSLRLSPEPSQSFPALDVDQLPQEGEPVDRCPFCEDALTYKPKEMLARAKSVQKMKGKKRRMAIFGFCAEHLATSSMPKEQSKAVAGGWPQDIDFRLIPSRLEAKKSQLSLFHSSSPKAQERGEFWDDMIQDIERHGKHNTFGVGGISRLITRPSCGYYGEKGYVVITQALQTMFPQDSITATSIRPLPYSIYIGSILVAEATVLLIQEDLKIDRSEALEIRKASAVYGIYTFPDGPADDKPPVERSKDQIKPGEQAILPIPKRKPSPEPEYKGDLSSLPRRVQELEQKKRSQGSVSFHYGITHNVDKTAPTVTEADTDPALLEIQQRLCEMMVAEDRYELELPLSRKDLEELGFTVVSKIDKNTPTQLDNKIIASGSTPPLSSRVPSSLLVAVRGKELALAYKKYAIRVSFATQGHCFWIPNKHFDLLISTGAKPFTSKGRSYFLPLTLQEESQGQALSNKRHLRITMSFKGPSHTLVFVDHNMLMKFHIRKFKKPLGLLDLRPQSEAWPLLWGKNHGPDVILERAAWLREYEAWVSRIQDSDSPLLQAYLKDNKVSNGWGEWQGTDVLARASLHPLWSASRFSNCPEAVARLEGAIIAMAELYNPQTNKPTKDLPFITVFKSEDYAHQDWLAKAVFVYRKSSVSVSEEELDSLLARGLLSSYNVINVSGDGTCKDGVNPTPLKERPRTTLRVFKLVAGNKTYYTHLEADPIELK